MRKEPWIRRWRVMNTAILLFGFFSPWLKGCNDSGTTTYGFQVANPGNLMLLLADPVIAIFFIIGIVGLLAYILANAKIIFSSIDLNQNRNIQWSIWSSVIGLFFGLFLILNADWCIPGLMSSFCYTEGFSRIGWGYWLTLTTLISCVALEINNNTSPPTERLSVEEIPKPPHYEFSEKIRSHIDHDIPNHNISTILSIPDSDDSIVMIQYTGSFQNVLRCNPDGSILWRAELPTDSDDVYTNIEWKNQQLTAFSRSLISVVLDVETGKILSPKRGKPLFVE